MTVDDEQGLARAGARRSKIWPVKPGKVARREPIRMRRGGWETVSQTVADMATRQLR